MIEILIAGVFTLGSSLVGYAVGSKKSTAEVDNLTAETEKIEQETEHLRVINVNEKLDLIEKLMLKIDSMQHQMDVMQMTINRLEKGQCIEEVCPINLEYKKILEKREARKKTIKTKAANKE